VLVSLDQQTYIYIILILTYRLTKLISKLLSFQTTFIYRSLNMFASLIRAVFDISLCLQIINEFYYWHHEQLSNYSCYSPYEKATLFSITYWWSQLLLGHNIFPNYGINTYCMLMACGRGVDKSETWTIRRKIFHYYLCH
jgi:hypothetical protein